MATRTNNPPKPFIGFGTRVRKSPYFESTLKWGCKEYTTYNHMYFPVYYNNRIVGVVTSGAYGFRINKSLAFAYVEAELAEEKKELEVKILGQKKRAIVLKNASYDDENKKLKS